MSSFLFLTHWPKVPLQKQTSTALSINYFQSLAKKKWLCIEQLAYLSKADSFHFILMKLTSLALINPIIYDDLEAAIKNTDLF